jgi:hypothetical protein
MLITYQTQVRKELMQNRFGLTHMQHMAPLYKILSVLACIL